MKKLLVPMMAAALLTGLSGQAFAHGHEGEEHGEGHAVEKAPAKKKGKVASSDAAPKAKGKGKGKHAKKGNGCGENGCKKEHKDEGAKHSEENSETTAH